MRTLIILTVGLMFAEFAAAQTSTASQTVRITIQPPARLVAQLSTVMLDLRTGERGLIGQAGDHMAIRSQAGRKITASLTESMPSGTRLVVQLGAAARRSGERIILTDARRSFDVATDLSPGATAEAPVEYALLTDAASPMTGRSDRTVMFTLTD